jgi:hypothetical protein
MGGVVEQTLATEKVVFFIFFCPMLGVNALDPLQKIHANKDPDPVFWGEGKRNLRDPYSIAYL